MDPHTHLRALQARIDDLEARLNESESRYRQLADHVHDVIWTLDMNTWRYTYISPSIQRLRGLTVEEALVEPVEQSLTPESLARVMATHGRLGEVGGLGPPRGADVLTEIYDQPHTDGTIRHVEITMSAILDETRTRVVSILGVSRDVTARVRAERERERTLEALRGALAEVKRLSGFIPICAHCKRVRDDAGYWAAVEEYVSRHSEARFSHGICPGCLATHFPDVPEDPEHEPEPN